MRQRYTKEEAIQRYKMFCKRNCHEEKFIEKVDHNFNANLYCLFDKEHLVYAFKPEILYSEVVRPISVTLPRYKPSLV